MGDRDKSNFSIICF